MTRKNSAIRSRARSARQALSAPSKATRRGRLATLVSLLGLGVTLATTAYRLRREWQPLARNIKTDLQKRLARSHRGDDTSGRAGDERRAHALAAERID